MSDLQDTLDAIDRVTGCQHCGGPLGPSPSDDFCCEAHQTAWHAARTDRPKPDPAASPYMSPTAALAYMHGYDERPQRDEAAVGRVQAGQWLARFAAPWHPRPMTVRSEYQGRPPQMLLAVRPAPMPIWPMEDPTADSVEFRPDRYQLESVNEHDRSAIYRIQGLPGPRMAVFRWAEGQSPTWWLQGDWEGRGVEVEGDARGFRWAHPNGDRLIAEPTERYETLPDGTVAEVWEPRRDWAESVEEFRAAMNRRRSLQEAMLRAPAPLDLQTFRRITGV